MKYILKRIRGRISRLIHRTANSPKPFLVNQGHCPICEADVTFVAYNQWLRDYYICTNCGSIPRERALMLVIEKYFPNWRDLIIHESSPAARGASARLAGSCKHYIQSQWFQNTPPGSTVNGILCENLEEMTFEDESIDIHVTQDVMEHVFHPSKVWKEIARTLKPGGAHIFTVPLVNKTTPSTLRAMLDQYEKSVFLLPPIYHQNPISKEGSLVTVDWGFDICQHIFDSCGLFTQTISIDDISKGIRAEYIEVLLTFKSKPLTLLTNYGIP